MNRIAEDIIMHYGMPRRSGRYPWGSGEDPYQHSIDFLGRIDKLKQGGWTETPENIKKEFNMTTTQYRTEKRLANHERRTYQVATAKTLQGDGLGYTEIGRKMGLSESTVRSLLNPKSEVKMKQAENTADFIREQIAKKGMIDVGTGVERELNISKETLEEALTILESEGHPIYKNNLEQVTNPGKFTVQRIICPEGTQYKETYDSANVHALNEDNWVSRDGGESYDKFQYPKSMDPSRLMIRYSEQGGLEKDGIVELRRGVDDLSLGNDRYSQVRILVDNDRYIKGMAVYSDDMPDGVDVIFNTNKSSDVPMRDVLKPIKDDPDNPFGSLIKAGGQSKYIDADGNEQLSLINKRASEGDWTEWKDALPSQFLSKQPKVLVDKQLDLAKKDKLAEFEEICSVNNPTVKKYLLEEFASSCDAAAVNLQAAALPGQKYHVIIPINSLRDTEVYAPRYENGSQLALIRYPHGGTFEIPKLIVNNKNPDAKNIIGTTAIDAIGINKNIADRLSGADFDGDTVMAIPTNDPNGKVKIKSTPYLDDLVGFDPKASYPEKPGMKYMSKSATGKEMGVITNLISDMTLIGADGKDLARAIKHSMVVIDAHKHKLDYKQSEVDNDIPGLMKKYRGYIDEDGKEHLGTGASTIVSKAKSVQAVPKRQGSGHINQKGKPWYDPSRPEGAMIYDEADDARYVKRKYDKDGNLVSETVKLRTQNSTKMAETDDAYTLISEARNPKEIAYADYANSMKALANKARMEMIATPNLESNRAAKKTYAAEVSSLMSKLNDALMNSPKEREAQRRANAEVKAKIESSTTEISKEDLKKMKQQAIARYRNEVGSVRRRDRNIPITDREWEAIQAGAISDNRLRQILDNTDVGDLRSRATPRSSTSVTPAKVAKIRAMSASNYSIEQIAESTGVSPTTVAQYLRGAN